MRRETGNIAAGQKPRTPTLADIVALVDGMQAQIDSLAGQVEDLEDEVRRLKGIPTPAEYRLGYWREGRYIGPQRRSVA